MAQYIKHWTKTGSTLTVNYPDELFTIVENPWEYYRFSGELKKGSYPSLLLIPTNGSFIRDYPGGADDRNWLSYHTTVIGTKYKKDKDTGVWSVDSVETNEYDDSMAFYPDIDFWQPLNGQNGGYGSIDTQLLKDECRTQTAYSLPAWDFERSENLVPEQNELDEYRRYTVWTYHTTITLQGETNFFSSNADFYFCHGVDKNNTEELDIELHGWFGDKSKKQRMVGGLVVMDGKNVVDMASLWMYTYSSGLPLYNSQIVKWDIIGSPVWVVCGKNAREGDNPFQQGQSSSPMRKNDCLYDGYDLAFNMSGRYYTPPKSYSLKGKRIRIIFDEMVAISDGQFDTFTFQKATPKEENDNYTVSLSEAYFWNGSDDNRPSPLMQTTKVADNVLFNFPNYDQWRKTAFTNAKMWKFTTREKIKYLNKQIKYEWSDPNLGLKFSDYYTFISSGDYPKCHQLVSTMIGEEYGDVPIFDGGLHLFPVFIQPPCIYIKLNTDHASDPKGILGNDTNNHHRIEQELKLSYGDNFIEREVDNWETTTVDAELKRLKQSPCQMKILYINCHGGKFVPGGIFNKNDESYALLSDPNRQVLDFQKLKYLLKDRRPDEYYFIYLPPCFAAGIMESYVHNDVSSQNYLTVNPSNDLGSNYLIWYADCSNSPSWGKTGGDGVCDLYNLNSSTSMSSELSYQAQANKINQIVQTCRQKNIQLLVDFLKDHYAFMKDTMVATLNRKWTDETYNYSISHAANLIIKLSREDEATDEYNNLVQTYPIVFLYALLMTLDDYKLEINAKLKSKQVFMVDNYVQYSYATSCFVGGVNMRMSDKDKNFLFNSEACINLFNDQQNYTQGNRELLIQYVNFFYDLYACWNKMAENSYEVRSRNGYPAYTATSYLLDDIPGAVFKGSTEFGNCEFPKYPEFVDTNWLDESVFNTIVYKEEV